MEVLEKMASILTILKSMLFMEQMELEELTENGLYISQNIPNPSNETTSINYVLPQTKGNAYLNITNGMGQIIDRLLLNNTAQNVEVSTSAFITRCLLLQYRMQRPKIINKKDDCCKKII